MLVMKDISRLQIASRSVIAYLGALIACLVIVILTLKLWRADIHVPFVYGYDDSLCFQMWVKAVIDNPWYLHNPFLSYPGVMELEDFPLSDSLQFLLVKLISFGCRDYAVVLNVYFLLTFPAIALLTLAVFRRFQVAYLPALVGSLLFAFTPYHFIRGEDHLFLADYYLIPLIVMVILRICQGWDPYPQEATTGPEGNCRWPKREFIASLIICGMMGGMGVYYAFFSCYLLLGAGIWSGMRLKRIRPLVYSGVFIGAIALSVFANLAPTIIHDLRHGANPEAVVRKMEHVETYALKIENLLFPIPGHRLQKYFHPAYSVGYDWGTNLGIIGGFGFLFLVGRFVFHRARSAVPHLHDSLGNLTILSLLLGTTGGFGYLFSFLVSPWIRCYYRISIFIAFFAVFAVVLLLNKLAKWTEGRKHGQLFYYAASLGILVVGILDQTSKSFVPAYAAVKAEFQSDAEFVKAIESRIPGQAIFQLPHVPFPEFMAGQIICYDLFRGFLHSNSLHWSGGTIKGRSVDYWQREVARLPPEKMVRTLALAGFAGIYLDRNGFSDRGLDIEAGFNRVLGIKPLVSRNERLAFFDLTEYSRRLHGHLSQQEWNEERDQVLMPLSTSIFWRGGFSYLDGNLAGNYRWCSNHGTLEVVNASNSSQIATIEMRFSRPDLKMSHLWIHSSAFSDHLELYGDRETPYRKEIEISPGRQLIHFRCDGLPIQISTDPRSLVFRVHDFKIDRLNHDEGETSWQSSAPRGGN
jgi:phosphoglycerol transferase